MILIPLLVLASIPLLSTIRPVNFGYAPKPSHQTKPAILPTNPRRTALFSFTQLTRTIAFRSIQTGPIPSGPSYMDPMMETNKVNSALALQESASSTGERLVVVDLCPIKIGLAGLAILDTENDGILELGRANKPGSGQKPYNPSSKGPSKPPRRNDYRMAQQYPKPRGNDPIVNGENPRGNRMSSSGPTGPFSGDYISLLRGSINHSFLSSLTTLMMMYPFNILGKRDGRPTHWIPPPQPSRPKRNNTSKLLMSLLSLTITLRINMLGPSNGKPTNWIPARQPSRPKRTKPAELIPTKSRFILKEASDLPIDGW